MKKSTLQKIRRYWADIRAIRKATGLDILSVRRGWSRVRKSRKDRPSRDQFIEQIAARLPGTRHVRLFPYKEWKGENLENAFHLRDHSQVTSRIGRLKAGVTEYEVQAVFIVPGEDPIIQKKELGAFDYPAPDAEKWWNSYHGSLQEKIEHWRQWWHEEGGTGSPPLRLVLFWVEHTHAKTSRNIRKDRNRENVLSEKGGNRKRNKRVAMRARVDVQGKTSRGKRRGRR